MKHVLHHADCTAPTLQHELDLTDQESICPEGSNLDHELYWE